MTDRTPDLDTPAPRLAETRARQGFRDRPVLIVLAVSLLLAVIAVFGIMLWQPGQLASLNADAGHDRRDAEAFDTPVQAPKGE
jgi:hypothetical protein